MKMMTLEEAKEYTRQKLAPYYDPEKIENIVNQYVSGARLETSPASRRGMKILISDLKIEPFSKKKKIQKLKNEIPTVKRQYAQ